MRTKDEVHTAIIDMTDAERGRVIERIRRFDWTDEHKRTVTTFIMLLGMIGRSKKKPN